ncbi:mitochondrial protein Surfeit 1/SURF1/SHY1 [Moesziomyces antarcticus T-34]|uniref:SURF1-like protein n=1 Tax=Pseudozyma antarctica (strain T-34) TaxID=1151754 RepID=M9LUH5_PSEA3|nr:mitochondrial protein Surfeit 1/SURF1/SHY1 [Moesziomyces antarcticus T-34]
MKATPQLRSALGTASSTLRTHAGTSYALARPLTPALQPLSFHRPPLALPTPLGRCTPIRGFRTTPRAQQQYEAPDAPEGYSQSQSAKSHRKWYRSPTTLVLGFIPIFTAALGYWQLKRLKWKVSLIEELEDKLSKAPLRLPRNINIDVLPEFDFRLVQVRGSFDHARTMFVGPRVRDGTMGYHVVVPFRRAEGGGMILVNRGFVAEKQIQGTGAQRRLKDEAMLAGQEEFVALLPRIYPANLFTPDNVPDKGSWFHVDAKQMAQWASDLKGVKPLELDGEDSYTPSAGVAESVKNMLGAGTDRVLPVYLEQVFDGNVGEAATRIAQGIPVGRAATIELRNQHAVYAATW